MFLVDPYHGNWLLVGILTAAGTAVGSSKRAMPVLTVIGTNDQFIPAVAISPSVDAIASTVTEVIEFPIYHVGFSIDERTHADWGRAYASRSKRSRGPYRQMPTDGCDTNIWPWKP